MAASITWLAAASVSSRSKHGLCTVTGHVAKRLLRRFGLRQRKLVVLATRFLGILLVDRPELFGEGEDVGALDLHLRGRDPGIDGGDILAAGQELPALLPEPVDLRLQRRDVQLRQCGDQLLAAASGLAADKREDRLQVQKVEFPGSTELSAAQRDRQRGILRDFRDGSQAGAPAAKPGPQPLHRNPPAAVRVLLFAQL